MANENTGFAVAPEGGVSQDEYASGSWDWFRPLHITGNQGTSVSPSISTAGLAEQSGIKTTVAKPDMNLQLGRIHDKTQRDDTYFNILSGQGAFNSQGVKFDFDTMINKGITGQGSDKTSWEGKLGNITNYMPMLLGMGGGKQGFGATLEGPTGKQVFSIGGFSENALQKHYKNFTTSSASYDEMNKEGKTHYNFDTGFASTIGNNHLSRAPNQRYYDGQLSMLHSNEHTAFNIAKSMEAISKGLDPRGSGGFKGYSLTGSNEDNRGGSDARHPSGMGMITNDGYYTYVDGKSDFGHSKVKLRGGSETIAVWKNLTSKGYNITKAQMLTAMENARAGGVSFSEGIKKYKAGSTDYHFGSHDTGGGHFDSTGKWSGNVGFGMDEGTTANRYSIANRYSPNVGFGMGEGTDYLKSNLNFGSGKGSPMPVYTSKFDAAAKTHLVGKPLSGGDQAHINYLRSKVNPATVTPEDIRTQDALRKEEWQDRTRSIEISKQKHQDYEFTDFTNIGKTISEANKKAGYAASGRYGLNTGGQVGNNPIGQLANLLRSNRLGYNTGGRIKGGVYGYQEGGEINLQEMGLVNGKTPDQVTDAQSVADTEQMDADDGDFVINAPAVEAVGVGSLMDLMMGALDRASEEGVQIVDVARDTSPDEMVEVFVSEGEFIVPRELIPFVEGGIETLEKINALGTEEVSRRVGEGEFNEEAMMEQMSSLQAPPEEIPEPQPMRYGDRVKRIIPSEGFV